MKLSHVLFSLLLAPLATACSSAEFPLEEAGQDAADLPEGEDCPEGQICAPDAPADDDAPGNGNGNGNGNGSSDRCGEANLFGRVGSKGDQGNGNKGPGGDRPDNACGASLPVQLRGEFGDKATLKIDGPSGFSMTMEMRRDGSSCNYQGVVDVPDNLAAGEYTVSVTGANGAVYSETVDLECSSDD